MKKLLITLLLAISYSLFTASPAFAHENHNTSKDHHTHHKAYFQTLKDKYYPKAANNEIYILPQDLPYQDSYIYYIKEFKGGFQRGQYLIGNMGTDEQYFLYVIDTTNDTTIAILEQGNPNDIQRYDRLLIAVHDTPTWK